MPEFKCTNEECSEKDKVELVPRARFIWNEAKGKVEAKEAICKVCGQQREVVREAGPIQIPWFKSEDARNYNNQSIKQYDYDHEAANAKTVSLKNAMS